MTSSSENNSGSESGPDSEQLRENASRMRNVIQEMNPQAVGSEPSGIGPTSPTPEGTGSGPSGSGPVTHGGKAPGGKGPQETPRNTQPSDVNHVPDDDDPDAEFARASAHFVSSMGYDVGEDEPPMDPVGEFQRASAQMVNPMGYDVGEDDSVPTAPQGVSKGLSQSKGDQARSLAGKVRDIFRQQFP